jgi:hypothetical protein
MSQGAIPPAVKQHLATPRGVLQERGVVTGIAETSGPVAGQSCLRAKAKSHELAEWTTWRGGWNVRAGDSTTLACPFRRETLVHPRTKSTRAGETYVHRESCETNTG